MKWLGVGGAIPPCPQQIGDKVKEIKTTTKRYGYPLVFVDDDDYNYLNQWKWHVISGSGGVLYAYRQVRVKGTKKFRKLKMHRIIMDNPKGLVVDHINHNTLDNRKANLRVCSNSQNIMNSIKRKKGLSKYKGVTKVKRANCHKYHARIMYNRKSISLGIHIDENSAAIAYNCAARILFGEYACENSIVQIG